MFSTIFLKEDICKNFNYDLSLNYFPSKESLDHQFFNEVDNFHDNISEDFNSININKFIKSPEKDDSDDEYKLLNKKTTFTSLKKEDEQILEEENKKVEQNNEKIFKIIKKRKNMGRKTEQSKKDSKEKNQDESNKVHTKYYIDNIIRKIKPKFFNSLKDYIIHLLFQKKEIKKQSNKIFCSTSDNVLVKVNQSIIKDIKVDHVLEQLNLKLKDIFSFRTGEGKYKNYNNKDIINKIYEQNNERLINIFELTFRECLSHFIGKKFYPQLEGFEKRYPEILQEMRAGGEDEKYIMKFQYVFENFEGIMNDKTPRGNKK